MPSYVIHLATANEYLRKHKNEITNLNDFFLGAVSPDFTTKEKKGETHFGESSSVLYLRQYLEKKDLNTDFNKGYFLHLVTDYIFYNKLLECTSKDIYTDYDILNKYLIEKYNVTLVEEVKDKVFFLSGETKILHKDLAELIINLASDMSLEDIKNEILSTDYTEKWDKIRRLKKLD